MLTLWLRVACTSRLYTVSLDGPGYVTVAQDWKKLPLYLSSFSSHLSATIAVIRIVTPFRTYAVDSARGYFKSQQNVSPLGSSIKRSAVQLLMQYYRLLEVNTKS